MGVRHEHTGFAPEVRLEAFIRMQEGMMRLSDDWKCDPETSTPALFRRICMRPHLLRDVGEG
jgi:hypothetical protein